MTFLSETAHITIPLSPVTKKNSQMIVSTGAGRKILPSKAYREYEKNAGWFIPRLGIDCAVNIRCLYYMPTHRRVDLVNLLEATLDVLVKYGAIADDNSLIAAGHDGSRVLYDKQNPRTEIYITGVNTYE